MQKHMTRSRYYRRVDWRRRPNWRWISAYVLGITVTKKRKKELKVRKWDFIRAILSMLNQNNKLYEDEHRGHPRFSDEHEERYLKRRHPCTEMVAEITFSNRNEKGRKKNKFSFVECLYNVGRRKWSFLQRLSGKALLKDKNQDADDESARNNKM